MLTLVGGVSMWCHAGYRVNPVERVGLENLGKRYSEPRRDAAYAAKMPRRTAQDKQTDACPCLGQGKHVEIAEMTDEQELEVILARIRELKKLRDRLELENKELREQLTNAIKEDATNE